jgi:hypothetical protein
VTVRTQWNSSNPSVAMFAAPGFLKELGPGVVVVSAAQGFLTADLLAFTVAPGSTLDGPFAGVGGRCQCRHDE